MLPTSGTSNRVTSVRLSAQRAAGLVRQRPICSSADQRFPLVLMNACRERGQSHSGIIDVTSLLVEAENSDISLSLGCTGLYPRVHAISGVGTCFSAFPLCA